MILLLSMSTVLAGTTYNFSTSTGDILLNTSIITGTKINCSDILNLASCTATGGGGGNGSDGFWPINPPYLYNNSGNLDFNETKLNATIDARSGGGGGSDGFWPIVGSKYLINNSGNLNINETVLNTTIQERADLFDDDTLYFNSTGLALATQTFSILLSYRLPQGCADGEIPEYNTTSGGWDCAVDNTAASGMASWVLAALGVGGSESITDGETVTFGKETPYLSVSRSTNNINYSFNETKLNATIDARSGSDTVWSLNTSDIYNQTGSLAMNRTTLNAEYVEQNEYPLLDTDSTDDFNGLWSSLAGVPAGFSDDVDNDTQYTALGLYVLLSGTEFSLNETKLNATIDARDSDTTYSALSNFTNDVGYFNTELNLTTLLDDNYVSATANDNKAGNLNFTDGNITIQQNNVIRLGAGCMYHNGTAMIEEATCSI